MQGSEVDGQSMKGKTTRNRMQGIPLCDGVNAVESLHGWEQHDRTLRVEIYISKILDPPYEQEGRTKEGAGVAAGVGGGGAHA